jgi:hypothetical protein
MHLQDYGRCGEISDNYFLNCYQSPHIPWIGTPFEIAVSPV